MLYQANNYNTEYYDALEFLDECAYLDEDESYFHPQEAPVIAFGENAIVDYNYIEKIMEDTGCSVEEARYIIAESHNLNYDDLYIRMNEYDVLAFPEILEEMAIEPILAPISENDIAYQLCEACIDAFIESGDDTWLACILDEGVIENITKVMQDPSMTQAEKYNAVSNYRRQVENDPNQLPEYAAEIKKYHEERDKKNSIDNQLTNDFPSWMKPKTNNSPGFFTRGKNWISDKASAIGNEYKSFGSDLKAAAGRDGIGNKLSGIGSAIASHKGAAAGIVGVAAGGVALKKFIDYRKKLAYEAANRPRTWIARKISSLRSIYQKYLQRAKAAKAKHQASVFQRIASVILGCIDFLLRKLQKGTDRIAGYKTNPR